MSPCLQVPGSCTGWLRPTDVSLPREHPPSPPQPNDTGWSIAKCAHLTNNVSHRIPIWHRPITMAYSKMHADVQFGAQGRIVVPAPIRKALGFQPGETLVARVEDDHLVIEKPESVERRIRARFRGAAGRSLADELITERREEARRDIES